MCLKNSDPMNSLPRKVEELGLNASAGHIMKFSGCTWYETKIRVVKKGNLEASSKKSEPHQRKPHDKQSAPAKQRGIWREKYESSKPKIKLRFSPVERKGARNREDRMFVVDFQNLISDLPRLGKCKKRGSTGFCS